MKVIAFGDSITYGQNVRSSEAWPAVLERLTGHDVRNEGVCGETTRLGLERFPKAVQLHEPDVVCIQYGCNDANRWASDLGPERVGIDAYVANIADLIARCAAVEAKPIVLRPHQPETPDSEYNERVALYAIALKTKRWDWPFYAPALKGWDCCYCAPMVSLLDDGYGVHPDPAMHQRYAGLVARVLGEQEAR